MNARKYAHFDQKVSLNRVWKYISEPQNIIKHGFYPFICHIKQFNKYGKDKDGKPIKKLKERKICYSAHIDRYIFSYYGFKLNNMYNEYVMENGINNVSLAYRNNLKQSNIEFAKRAFDFIKNTQSCYIIIGDFTNFFDKLQHKYLKNCICKVMNMDKLPEDYFAVYKNITKYSEWKLSDLLEINNLDITEKNVRKLNTQEKVITLKQFKKYKKEQIYKNNNDYGIPQGSAISAVLSNIYMIECDEKINNYITKSNGLYLRYSDDFIIVIPDIDEIGFKGKFDYINKLLKSIPNLELQSEKTQVYTYKNMMLKNCNSLVMKEMEDGKNFINYLGFTFDGVEVTIREKTISKYYYRMYRKLKTIKKRNGYVNTTRISCKNVYEKYSSKGAHIKGGKGNFISYVDRSKKCFPEEPIDRKTKRHMLKIRREIDKAFE